VQGTTADRKKGEFRSLDRLRKITKNSVRMAGVSAKVQTEHLLNMSLKRFF
jgi:hypothetical protein